jgi:hypothetical protein
MPTDPEMPHTQTSAPTQPPETTQDVPRREAGSEQAPSREADRDRGDRMPIGADEPGAGL